MLDPLINQGQAENIRKIGKFGRQHCCLYISDFPPDKSTHFL